MEQKRVEYTSYREHRGDKVWWVNKTVDGERPLGEHIFTFDKKKLFNLFRDYPDKLYVDEWLLFNEENPFWADFFEDRNEMYLIAHADELETSGRRREAMESFMNPKERDALYDEVRGLYYQVSDELNDGIVRIYFDIDSMRKLEKKKRVLQALLDGKSHEEIGWPFLEVLEKLPKKVLSGKVTVEVSGWPLNANDFSWNRPDIRDYEKINGLRFFGADEARKSFAIFKLERKDAMNMYIWAFPNAEGNERVWVEFVSRMFSYLDHVVSPFSVREEDCGEIIERALRVLKKYPKKELAKKMQEFEERMRESEEYGDEWFERWVDTEEEMFKEVEKARKESGYWPWIPKE